MVSELLADCTLKWKISVLRKSDLFPTFLTIKQVQCFYAVQINRILDF